MNSKLNLFGRRSRWEIFEKTLLVIVLLELALGGNGYLLKVGPFRLREVLFVVCMVWVVIRLVRVNPIRLEPTLVAISILFFAGTAFGTIFGYLQGNRPAAIIAELKPLSYFAMLPFFLVTIRRREDLTVTAGILVVCAMILASAYLLLLLSAEVGISSYRAIYHLLRQSDEFIFRPWGPSHEVRYVGFLYKGTFYICIAVFFLAFDPFKLTKILAGIAVVAIAMTVTRGLCLAVVGSLLVGTVFHRNWKRWRIPVLLSAVMLGVLFLAQRAEQEVISLKAPPASIPAPAAPIPVARPGDSLRIDDVKYIVHELDWQMLAIGRGIGAPIRGRDRIEFTYFEILYKQGILGLSVWIALGLYLLRLYLAVPRENREFGLAFFLSGLFVYLATATNTFLTGSIGMAALFISLAGLLVLGRESRRRVEQSDWYGRRLGACLR